MSVLDVKREDVTPEMLECYKRFTAGFENFTKDNDYAKSTRLDAITLLDLLREWCAVKQSYETRYLHIGINYKQAAALMYWIVKTKPIYFQFGSGDPLAKEEKYYEGRYNAVNEHFALCMGAAMLGFDLEDMDEALKEHFIYTLYYFNAAPEPLFFMLEMAEALTKNAAFIAEAKKTIPQLADKLPKDG